MDIVKHCKTCLLSDKEQMVCMLSNQPIDLSADFCSKHRAELHKCSICRRSMISPGIIEINDSGEVIEYCNECNAKVGTCYLCNCVNQCAFNNDPNPMPKVVLKTIRQGNMMMQAQVKNEERVKLFCHSCPCWDAEFAECQKENYGSCNKYSSRNS